MNSSTLKDYLSLALPTCKVTEKPYKHGPGNVVTVVSPDNKFYVALLIDDNFKFYKGIKKNCSESIREAFKQKGAEL